MHKILSFLLIGLLASGCASPGTIDPSPTKSALGYVVERVDAYIVLHPEIPKDNIDAYNASKASVAALPANKRVAAANSWLAISYICDFHDALVNADGTLDAVRKASYLRTTELLRKQSLEAFKAEGRAPPAPESRSAGSFPCPDGSCTLGR